CCPYLDIDRWCLMGEQSRYSWILTRDGPSRTTLACASPRTPGSIDVGDELDEGGVGSGKRGACTWQSPVTSFAKKALDLRELELFDATDQARLCRSGEVTPVELVEAAIARVERLNPALNAVVTEMFESALAAAGSSSIKGPLS